MLPIGSSSIALFLALMVAAVVLRANWVVNHGTVPGGCGYTRIAKNLLTRGSYVGLFEGPELVFPPFFPVLLALGSLFSGSVEGAARLIPFVARVLFVPIAFALARLVYGPRVALVVAAVIRLHPVLIDLSSTAESEGVYLPLMLGGLYWALRAIDSVRLAYTIRCGATFGLAYLTRPEALIYPFVVLVAMLATDLRRSAFPRRLAMRSLCLFAPIVVLAAPYLAYLSVQMGSLRLDGKGSMNYTIGERENSGMGHHEASLGIGPDLSEDGTVRSSRLTTSLR